MEKLKAPRAPGVPAAGRGWRGVFWKLMSSFLGGHGGGCFGVQGVQRGLMQEVEGKDFLFSFSLSSFSFFFFESGARFLHCLPFCSLLGTDS